MEEMSGEIGPSEIDRMIADARAVLQEHGGVPAFEDELIGEFLVQPGAKRFVTITIVRRADEVQKDKSGLGLRFELSDEDHQPLYSFAIDHRLLYGALAVAWPEGGSKGSRT